MPTSDFRIVTRLRSSVLLLAGLAYALPAAAYPVFKLASTSPPAARDAAVNDARLATELDHWQAIQVARSPSRVAELSRAFQRDYPQSTRRGEAWELEIGAMRASAIHRDVGLSAEFFEETRGDVSLEAKLLGAARGDADSAFGVARAFREGKSGVGVNARRHEQWLRIASELGHAGASWELAQLENRNGRVAEAAHYEKRAKALGYKPAPRLSNRDY